MLAKQTFLIPEPSRRLLENATKLFYEQGNELAFFIPAVIAMGKLSETKEHFYP